MGEKRKQIEMQSCKRDKRKKKKHFFFFLPSGEAASWETENTKKKIKAHF